MGISWSGAGWEARTGLIKLAGLVSSCGGPLIVMDRLKGAMNPLPAFLIGFLPVGVMVVGAFFLEDDVNDRLARRMVELGRVGMFVMVGMQLYGILAHVVDPTLPNRILHGVGIGVGLLSAVAYQLATRRFRGDREVSVEQDHRPDRPIEPS